MAAHPLVLLAATLAASWAASEASQVADASAIGGLWAAAQPTQEVALYVPSGHVCDGFDEEWDHCDGLPACGPCVPHSCVWSGWSDWEKLTESGCHGLLFRKRGILIDANACGAPCHGPTLETKEYIKDSCKGSVDDGCRLSEWTEWSTATDPYCANKHDQATRTRHVISDPGPDGRGCNEMLQETRPCGGPPIQDCVFGTWQEWTTCSASCGEGRHTRMRRIQIEAKHGGKPCTDMVLETHPCVIAPCPGQDCVASEWAAWSACDQSHNQRFRERTVLNPATGSGRPCQADMKETVGCLPDEPAECVMSTWSQWSQCDKVCGGGQHTRKRELLKAASRGGVCPRSALEETRGCQEQSCNTVGPVNCAFGAWTEWSPCAVTCGGGTVRRHRQVETPGMSGGLGCVGRMEEAGLCMQQACPVIDCVWSEWEQWSACSETCGGGTKQRTRNIATAPRGGMFCAPQSKAEVSPCNTEPCGGKCIDGLWGQWLAWSECSGSCDVSYKSRRREIDRYANHCGTPPTGLKEEFVRCSHMPPCVPDRHCELSAWHEWSECSCSCSGIRERNRVIAVFPSGAGKTCDGDSLKMIEPCNPGNNGPAPVGCVDHPKVDCVMGEWSVWSRCSVSCGGGQTSRKRSIVQPAAYDGLPCLSDLEVTEPCGLQACEHAEPQDCVWGPWSRWGDCTRCGGQRYRRRSIERMANAKGKPCDLTVAKEVSNCKSNCEDELFCAWSEWSRPACDAACGNTTGMRSRFLGFHKEAPTRGYLFIGGEDSKCSGTQVDESLCPVSETCSNCVPMDCEFSAWSDWTELKCQGLCERHRTIATMNNECGAACNGVVVDTKHCEASCQEVHDCILSPWEQWSPCTHVDQHGGQKYRSRAILQKPSHGGHPCIGVLDETLGCRDMAPEPCRFAEWSAWSTCTVSCGRGWHVRMRTILRQASPLGYQCDGRTKELRPCSAWNERDCGMESDVNCKFSSWGKWSACDGVGMRYKHRDIVSAARFGGQACEGAMHKSASCAPKAVDCAFSAWTQWSACDRTCGQGGQASRQRQINTFPQHGGEPCPTELMQTKGCHQQQACITEDAAVSRWTMWSACSTTCGPGEQSRIRRVLSFREPGGYGAKGELAQARQCVGNPPCSITDCVWEDWRAWGECTRSCGAGYRERQRRIGAAPDPAGRKCDAHTMNEVEPCNERSCDPHCQHGEWDDWSDMTACSATCGGGTRYRRRQVKVMANACGSPPTGKDQEVEFCNENVDCNPHEDCTFGRWADWTACSDSCNGIMQRTREIFRYGRGNGQKCTGALKQTYPCNPTAGQPQAESCQTGQKKDCKWSDWNPWSACSASCDGGQQTRSRYIIQKAENGGLPCKDTQSEVQECARNTCDGSAPVDCELGEWEAWGSCTSCDGVRYRHRIVIRQAQHGGRDCAPGDLGEAGPCNVRCPGPQFCTWQNWDHWSECTATCGTGGKRRHRRYLKLTNNASDALDPVIKAAAEHSSAIQQRIKELEAHHSNELLIAFVAGCGCLLVTMAGLRSFALVGRNAQAHEAASRAPLFASRPSSGAESPSYASLLIQGGEVE